MISAVHPEILRKKPGHFSLADKIMRRGLLGGIIRTGILFNLVSEFAECLKISIRHYTKIANKWE